MTSARARVSAFWDAHINAWLAGGDPLPSSLLRWFKGYKGVGEGEPTLDGFPEPFHGDLLGQVREPRMVVLGLNPGKFHDRFQARDSLFAEEIRKEGSYSSWATTFPYDRDPWIAHMGINKYYRDRLRFTRNWLEDPAADHRDLLIFEFYPWHSTKIQGEMKPPTKIIDEFVWQPIAELPVQQVFAFGRPWDNLAQTILPQTDKLGLGGRPYGSQKVSRAVRIYELPSGKQLVVEWHSGGAGPPSAEETAVLRKEFA
ncbi:anti-phage DNA glycosylase Brig1 [Micromonospora psammae]|uniref:anti-phage DNA glycosylase Brig1 n=1 Tax=Micromonospora sp. CPCC 205556 TaxID=3122398 RepID=UPI002FF393D4